MLEAEIKDIELVAQRELTPLPVGMPVDPLRRGSQVIRDKVDQLVELLVAAFADDGRATAFADGDDFAHNEIAFSNMPSRSAWSKAALSRCVLSSAVRPCSGRLWMTLPRWYRE